jgi:hypothetical protein
MISTEAYSVVQLLWTDPAFHQIVRAEIQKTPPQTVHDLARCVQAACAVAQADCPFPHYQSLSDQDTDDVCDTLTARYYALALKRYYDKRSV